MAGYYSEVRDFVAKKIDSGVIIRVEWLTREYMQTKPDIIGQDTAFYQHCATAHIQEMVRRVVGKYDSKPNASQDSQIVFEGFEHLQKAYTVLRDGENYLVPVENLTDAELLSRADEYDAMAKGCRLHAREIRNFVRERSGAKAA